MTKTATPGSIAAVALLCACATPPPQAPPPAAAPAALIESATPPPSAPAALSESELDRLDELLTRGDDALKDDRLLTPIDDSAYDYYTAALKLAPEHPSALAGISKLVDRYLVLAADAIQRGRYDRAKNLLERARFIDSGHDGIALAEEKIALFERATRRRIPLDGAALSSRSPEIAADLAAWGKLAKTDRAWVTISARNDAEGRWIYQQLRRAPGERRIRAELVIAAVPGLEIFELDALPESQ
jgi:hypothetical protein